MVGSTDFHSSHPQEHEPGRGAARAEDAEGTPTQSHVSPSILVYEDNSENQVWTNSHVWPGVDRVRVVHLGRPLMA